MRGGSWRMAGSFVVFIVICSSVVAFPARAADPAAAKAADAAAWSGKMKKLGGALQDVLIDVATQTQAENPKLYRKEEKDASRLAALAHGLGNAQASPDQDPTIAAIAQLFGSEAEHAAAELKRGNRLYARSVLRSLSGYCIACHTRGVAASLDSVPLQAALSRLGVFERAKFLAATRRFDAALDEFERLIADPPGGARSLEWEQSVRYALAIDIRVKRDPDRALAVVERVNAAEAPLFLKEQARQWKKSLLSWKEELPRHAMTEEGLHAEVVRLLAEAKAVQASPRDRSGDVAYLRASAALHDQLKSFPDGKYAGEGLLLAGICYEALRDLNLWELHDLYYQACIYRAPHTEIAQSCYRHYEEGVYLGYTGSGGVSIPGDVRAALGDLRRMAEPLPDGKGLK